MRSKHILVGGLLLFGGCAAEVTPLAPPPMAEELIRSLAVGRAQLSSVRAEARVDAKGKGRHVKFHASILVGSGSRLFVEAGGFGIPASLLSVGSGKATLYIPSDGKAFEGKADEVVLALAGVQYPAEEWAGLLLGRIPEIPQPIEKAVRTKKNWVLSAGEGRKAIKLTMDAKTGWLRRMERESPIRHTVSFGDPMNLTVGSYPKSITITTSEGVLEIRFSKVEENPTIPDALFRLDLPPGTPIRSLSEAG